MPGGEIAREFVIVAAADYELYFVAAGEGLQILHAERPRFA
jgi:hypothetical protein